MSSGGRRQGNRPTEPVVKRRRLRTRDSGSSSNGESSSVDRTQQSHPPLQQQQQQLRPGSPVAVTTPLVVNPTSSRPTTVAISSRQSRLIDSDDQIAPTSPRASRRTTSVHVSDQVPLEKPMDPVMQHQVSTLPKESFKLCNSDFIWLVGTYC